MAVYYLAVTGNDSGDGSTLNPWATFNHALTTIAASDTLLVKNGVYNQSLGSSTTVNSVEVSTVNPPSGVSGKPTIIKSETPGGAVITGNSNGINIFLDAAYVEIDGFTVETSTAGITLYQDFGSFNKIKNCGFISLNPANESNITSLLGADGTIEDCWICGYAATGSTIGRVYNYVGERNTLRRVVIRLDGYQGAAGYLGVTLYHAIGVTLDNVINVDFAASATTFSYKGGIRSRLGGGSIDHKFNGCISLNLPDIGYITAISAMSDCVAAGCDQGIWQSNYAAGSVDQCSVFDATTRGMDRADHLFTNNLMYNCGGNNDVSGSYNHFFNSTSTNQGASPLIDDPLADSIVQVKEGSPGFGTGGGGKNRGADVTKRYINGIKSNEDLWPWTNEDRIISDFRKVSDRGFAKVGALSLDGSPQTLTKYVLEYLGTQAAPAEPINMALRANNITPSSSYSQIKTEGSRIKAFAVRMIELLSATFDTSNISGMVVTLTQHKDKINTMKVTPGIQAYAKSQEDDALYDLSAEIAALIAVIDNTIISLKETAGSGLITGFDDNGAIWATFTPAEVAGLKRNFEAINAAII